VGLEVLIARFVLSSVMESWPVFWLCKLAAGAVSVRGLCRARRYAGEVYISTSVQTGISRVTSNVNSCSYTRCVYLFPTLHTNRHSTRREFTLALK